MLEEWDRRCTARATAIMAMVYRSFKMLTNLLLIFMALDIYEPNDPGPRASESDRALHDLYVLCRKVGSLFFIFNFIDALISFVFDVFLFMATDIQRAMMNREWCFDWVKSWILFECYGLIFEGMTMKRDRHGASVVFSYPMLSIIFVGLVMPYAIELNGRAPRHVRPQAQIVYSRCIGTRTRVEEKPQSRSKSQDVLRLCRQPDPDCEIDEKLIVSVDVYQGDFEEQS